MRSTRKLRQSLRAERLGKIKAALALTSATKAAVLAAPLPLRLDEPTHVVQSRKRTGSRPHITKAEREHTPPELADWLCHVARRSAK